MLPAYFCFQTILALERCLASFHFQNADESHRSFQGASAGNLWGPVLHRVNGCWRVGSIRAPPHRSGLFALWKKGTLSLNVGWISLCHTSQAGLKATGPATFLYGQRWGLIMPPASPRMLCVNSFYKGCGKTEKEFGSGFEAATPIFGPFVPSSTHVFTQCRAPACIRSHVSRWMKDVETVMLGLSLRRGSEGPRMQVTQLQSAGI